MEMFFGGPQLAVTEIVQQLRAGGLSCHEAPDEWGHWVVFEQRESTLNFSVDKGLTDFATLDVALGDPAEFIIAVETAIAKIGWHAEETEYE